MSFPEPVADSKVRGKPESLADHYSQATLFWDSQTPAEQAHIVRGFRFELTKVQVPAIRERTVPMLRNVADELAQAVADGLGILLPAPMKTIVDPPEPEVTHSPALSLTFRPGDGSIRGRRVAILVAPGVDAPSLLEMESAINNEAAVVRRVAANLMAVKAAGGELIEPDATFETMPSVLFDAVVVPDGDHAAEVLATLGQAVEFFRDQYRHCKAILVSAAGEKLAMLAGVPLDDDSDWAVVRDVAAFVDAVGRHRNWARATDPPIV